MTWADSLTLGAVGTGGTFTDGDWVETKDQDTSGGVRLTQLADVGEGSFRDRSNRWLREDQASRLGCTLLQPNDVLIARMPEPIARACLVPSSLGRAVTVVDVAVLRIRRDDVDPKYAMWALNTPNFRQAAEALQSGTTRKRISRKHLARLTIPLPSLREQQRIVEILEDHLSHLDAAEHDATMALKRLAGLEEALLRSLLTGQTHAAYLGDLLRAPLNNGKSVPSMEGGHPVLRLTALKGKGVDLAQRKGGDWTGLDPKHYAVTKGDLLVARGNGTLRLVGRASLVTSEPDDVAYPDTMIRVRADHGLIDSEYLAIIWNSAIVRSQIERVVRTSAGIYKINQKQLAQIRLPLPSTEDQRAAVERLGGFREGLNRGLATVDALQWRSGQLRRALLAAAFSGKLTGRHTDQEIIEELAQ